MNFPYKLTMAVEADNIQPAMSDEKPPTASADESVVQGAQHVILFYKYHPLSPDPAVTKIYRDNLEQLCRSLSLSGRILVGASRSEGINGNLAGRYTNVRAFTCALLGDVDNLCKECDVESKHAVEEFWAQTKKFFDGIGEQDLRMSSPDDFKWSCSSQVEPLFPDLNIKVVPELIGTGGVLSSIPLEETAKGYLSPQEWHNALSGLSQSSTDTILIDCRNTKEFTIGRFTGAIDPQTTTFAQFPKWVDDHNQLLADKKIYMYCTGGIRCEKASAYIRRQVPSIKDVKHLKGGIHKYLEEYGGSADDGGIWKGKNFVFDGRGAASAKDTKLGGDGNADIDTTGDHLESHDVVGKCTSCDKPYDTFDPHCVCTVCREPTLTCRDCQEQLKEYHCRQHYHLRSCYFYDINRFSFAELRQQQDGLNTLLDEIAVGRRFKQKRKTLQKQWDRIKERLLEITDATSSSELPTAAPKCRDCGEVDCSGRCWGFHSLKRKGILEQNKEALHDQPTKHSNDETQSTRRPTIVKKPRRDRFVDEAEQLLLSQPPSTYRDSATGVRVPPPCTRVLQTAVKAKWCGEKVLTVVQKQFVELARPEVIRQVLEHGLLRVNNVTVSIASASDLQLKMSDTISRVVHWHEPPVLVPHKIGVEKVSLPSSVLHEFGVSTDDDDAFVYVCNKPSSVPVHPAGPYLANSLTVMIEAQEKLASRSLNPIHRTDRVTSGLTVCCTNPKIARIFHRCLTDGEVQKMYLAKVHGRFPSSQKELGIPARDNLKECQWSGDYVEVVAPVETLDPANGIRVVSAKGKPSKSHFRSLKYNPADNTSLIVCIPVTGRNHQLRVHLQWIGFPIVDDIQYGGKVEPSSLSNQSDVGLNQMIASVGCGGTEKKLSSLSESDVLAAKQACECCTGGREGIRNSFSSAQLLKEGHSIFLHALLYRVTIRPKKRRLDKIKAEPLATVDLKVDLPDWVDLGIVDGISWPTERT
jgi:RluA family pseudouridine synthase